MYGRGLINKVKIPVQELAGQRGEGAYFRMGHILGEYGNCKERGDAILVHVERFHCTNLLETKCQKL